MISKLVPDQDDLYHKIKDNNSNYLKLQNAPNYKDFDDKLKTKKNNLERLIYVLANLDSEPLLNGKNTKQLLFGLQGAFLSLPMKEEAAIELLTHNIIDFSKVEIYKNEDSYLFIDGFPVMEDMEFKLFISLKNHKIISKIEVPSLTTNYNKKSWENFWAFFNWMQFGLSQFDIRLNEVPNQTIVSKEASIEEVLNNFDPIFATIIKDLFARNIGFNRDSSFYLEDENGAILAEAALGIPLKKIVIDPFDEDSRLRFIEMGYKELTIDSFNINDII
jgi:hypothetical protein